LLSFLKELDALIPDAGNLRRQGLSEWKKRKTIPVFNIQEFARCEYWECVHW